MKTFHVIPAPKVIPAVPAAPPTGIVPGKMHQNAPNGTKNANALYVPMAQQQRIVQLREMGKSVREISRREKRHRRTVTKVLLFNAAKMKEHMERSRQAFLRLTTEAIETVRQALKKGNVAIAYRLLVDTGVVPQPGQIPWSMAPASSESPELTAEQKYIAEFVETVMERAKDHGIHVDSI
ncbi:MAG: hypothetical protein WB795_18400 [Candidatus Acidiferrales bacterium]|jgi:hypothetical protein